VAPGTVSVTVTNSNGTSASANAVVQAAQPAFFQWNSYAVATMQVTVTVGGHAATVYGAALAAGYAGLYQVAIQIPASSPCDRDGIRCAVAGPS
jgi:hypothetical protein